jgi:hypothetical protein
MTSPGRSATASPRGCLDALIDQLDSDPLSQRERGEDAAQAGMGLPPKVRDAAGAWRQLDRMAADSGDPAVALAWLAAHRTYNGGPA